MNFCGWGSSSGCFKPSQLQPTYGHLQPRPIDQTYNNQKVSVKGTEIGRPYVRFCQPTANSDSLNQTQQSYGATSSNWGQRSVTPHSNEKPRRKNSIIDQISEGSEKQKVAGPQVSYPIRESSMYRSSHQRQRLRSEQVQFRSQMGSAQTSYAQLVKENLQLKKIVNEQYLPLKRMYEKLKQEQEDREYLVSQLQWKVRELAREIKARKF